MDPQLAAHARTAYDAFLRECGRRRSDPITVRIGTPGGPGLAIAHDPSLDAGFRADLLERALDDFDPATAIPWLTRGGVLVPGDPDLSWFAAARAAYGRHGAVLPGFLIITRDGWRNLLDDELVVRRPGRG